MKDEHLEAKIVRIDTNVKSLLDALPVIQRLDVDSAVNKREHKIFLSALAFAAPGIFYFIKALFLGKV